MPESVSCTAFAAQNSKTYRKTGGDANVPFPALRVVLLSSPSSLTYFIPTCGFRRKLIAGDLRGFPRQSSSSATSTRTRIETLIQVFYSLHGYVLPVLLPPEQGLKLIRRYYAWIEKSLPVLLPPEQGLKPCRMYRPGAGYSSSSATSTRTRIETPS